jgi:hypothetical protein
MYVMTSENTLNAQFLISYNNWKQQGGRTNLWGESDTSVSL